jgi:hypothetical protein
MKRLLRSAKFWTSVVAAAALILAKMKVNLSAEELAIIAAPFITLIGAIAAEDVAKAKAGK